MFEDTNVYSIVDLDKYAISLRDAVARTFEEQYSENLDEYISIQQIKGVIEGYSLGEDEDGRLLITEEVFNDIFDDIREWFYEVGLSKLAAKGVIECAWDNDTNQMVFWTKDNEQQSSSTTESRNR